MGTSVVGGTGCSLTRTFSVSTSGDFVVLFVAKWAAAVTGQFPTPFITRNASRDCWTAFQDDASNGNDLEVEYKTGATTNNDVSIGTNAALVGKWVHFAFVYTHSTGAQTIYCLVEGFNAGSPSFLISPSVGTTTNPVPTSIDVFTDTANTLPFINGKIAHLIVAPFAPTQAQVIAQFQQRAPTAAFSGAGSYTYLACTSAATVNTDAGSLASNFTKAGSFSDDATDQPSEWSNSTTPMTLTVTQTQTASRTRSVTPGAKTVTNTQAPSLAKGSAHAKALSATQTQSLSRQLVNAFARAFSVTQTQTTGSAPVVGPIGLNENATQTQTASKSQAVAATKTAAQTQTPTRTRVVTPGAKSAIQTQTPSLTKGQSFLKSLTATATQTLARVLAVGKPRSATQSSTGTVTRAVALAPKAATQTSTPSVARAVTPGPKTATNSQSPSLTKGQAFFRSLSANATQTASRALAVALTRSATQTSTGSLGPRSIARTFSAVTTQTAAQLRTIARAFSATQTQTGSATEVPSGGGTHPMTLSAVVTQTMTMARSVAKTILGSNTQAPAVNKTIAPAAKTASQTQTPSVTKGSAHTINASATNSQTGSVRRVLGMARSATASQLGMLMRLIGHAASATSSQAASVTRGVTPAPKTVTNSQTASVSKGQAHTFNALATNTQSSSFGRTLSIFRSVVTTQAPTLARGLSKQLLASVSQLASAARRSFYSAAATNAQTASETHTSAIPPAPVRGPVSVVSLVDEGPSIRVISIIAED